MSKKIYRNKSEECPYYLHDARINKIICRKNKIKFIFDNGYFVKGDEDCIPVKGHIEFQDADYDFCRVYVLNNVKNTGKFTGKKYWLKKFSDKYKKVNMEIIDETYYHNISKFTGWIYRKNKIKEFIIEIYHFGNMVYRTED